jgi:hypothetical protein
MFAFYRRLGGLCRIIASVVARAGRAGALLLAQHGHALRGVQDEPRLSEHGVMTFGVRRAGYVCIRDDMRSAIRAIAAIVLILQIVSDYAPAREHVKRVKRRNAAPRRVIRNSVRRIERSDSRFSKCPR